MLVSIAIPWKLTNFVVGEKSRAQNCLTVSNIKLDDVLSDVFGKASSNIIFRILENPSAKITNEADFINKRMKATDAEVLSAAGGAFCPEQTKKLRHIRSHMDSLELCKLNIESSILSVAEKHIPPNLFYNKYPSLSRITSTNATNYIMCRLNEPEHKNGSFIQFMELKLYLSCKHYAENLLFWNRFP